LHGDIEEIGDLRSGLRKGKGSGDVIRWAVVLRKALHNAIVVICEQTYISLFGKQ
jgi:hypothetical protein